MRISIVVSLTLAGLLSSNPLHADPYRWCANYGSGQGGSTNCYFLTLEQCQAAASGNGGFCGPNGFYDGRPVTTPGDGVPRPAKRRAH